MSKQPHPIQPLALDAHGVMRFKANKIVQRLLDFASERGMGLNEIAGMDFSAEDRQQLAQLIGYSLSGYGELRSYVDDDAYNAAVAMSCRGVTEEQARIATLTEELGTLRAALREPMARLFGVHPDDLNN